MNEPMTQSLGALAADGRCWVGLGLITAIESDSDLGYLATVELQHSTNECQARLVFPGAGSSAGLAFPVSVGDEVVVLMPMGDPNLAVAIAGLVSRRLPLPECFDNTTPQVTHPEGMEIRAAATDEAKCVVYAPFLQDFGTYLVALEAFMTACTGSADPTVAAAAAAFNLAKGSFAASVAQSTGGFPYGSTALRVGA